MVLGVMLAATVLSMGPVAPSYPGARLEAPPSMRLEADGTRVEESRLATPDALSVVKRRMVHEMGAGRVLADVKEDGREVVVIGISAAQPTLTMWRDLRDRETHLLVMRRLH